MKSTRRHVVVFVTAPTVRVARAIAAAILDAPTAACVKLLPGVESHYVWQGKRERAKECQLLIKTTRPRLAALERVVRAHHPYDTPEFVAAPLVAGAEKYLDWIDTATRDDQAKP